MIAKVVESNKYLLIYFILLAVNFVIASPNCVGTKEVFSFCMKHCDRRCGDPEVKRCRIKCTPGCVCAEGYARDTMKECVPIEECPQAAAPPLQRKPGMMVSTK